MKSLENFAELCGRALDGRASDEELEALRTALREHSECRRLYREQMEIHALLTWQQGAGLATTEAGKNPAPASVVAFPRKNALLALVAALVAGCFLLLNSPHVEKETAGVNVEVIAAEQSIWQPGQKLQARLISQESGAISFRLPQGVLVEAGTPVTLELLSPSHMKVLRGAVQVDVGPLGKGFVVETPQTRIVDLGTAFSVDLTSAGETNVVVLSGSVELHPPAAQADEKVVTLTEGEAVTVGSLWQHRRLQAVAIRGEGLGIVEGGRGKKPIVTNISDGINDTGFHRFYSIVPGGMGPGARTSSTHGKPLWQALPGAAFPAELLGADVIGTFMLDRFSRKLALEMEVSQPCNVYLMLDDRSPAPDWLQRDFQRTELKLHSGPWPTTATVAANISPDAYGLKFITYTVWSCAVPQPGTVKLGSPPLTGDVRHQAMFGIAVKAN